MVGFTMGTVGFVFGMLAFARLRSLEQKLEQAGVMKSTEKS
ncbi:hypothetical protein WM2015_3041 [Wenzhouxiangella marina]|uniref:Uncharacterized protein n=1 Tax=Wenzhouxiangella marina TaxID=1579979 RepID=A0A0K0Y0C2_9GAMM|nr:hypothetical protein WM2015_3041 [Wenzhouxiangella marina]